MNHTSYQIDLPKNSNVVVFYNGIKAMNSKGFFWLWQQLLSGNQTQAVMLQADGCLEVKLCICCSYREAVIVSYWQDEASLMKFFHSPLHRAMMKNMMDIIAVDSRSISVFNETYRPVRSGKYFNEPQGLAKIYPMLDKSTAT
jgi:heme-degrading monooxygenase HmoA